ncbi:MAG TPA: EF-P beta-lysylation protein EpmB, partial [Gammaproteobacteria bacterium]|nr:EF-P beta-lysylation protein EpmB [Gammaproteobacteria bacterium]
RLRLHTRVPIVLPERVDADFCDRLRRSPLTTIVVLHANHANEFDDTVRRACGDLRAAGATLLNQAVLLAGVNDSVGALTDLSTTSVECGVLPYYLHLLDRVQGASHFEVAEARALELHGELRDRLPGYLVPRLVREIAGASSKTPVRPSGLD